MARRATKYNAERYVRARAAGATQKIAALSALEPDQPTPTDHTLKSMGRNLDKRPDIVAMRAKLDDAAWRGVSSGMERIAEMTEGTRPATNDHIIRGTELAGKAVGVFQQEREGASTNVVVVFRGFHAKAPARALDAPPLGQGGAGRDGGPALPGAVRPAVDVAVVVEAPMLPCVKGEE